MKLSHDWLERNLVWLIVLIVCLNLGAITIRNRLRARFKGASF